MDPAHPTLEETAAFAGMLHASQADLAGAPYFGHLARVTRHLLRLFPDATLAERHAAWLHDAFEDTPCTAAELAQRGYDPLIVSIISAVTKTDDGRPYDAWIAELGESGFVSAMRVKLADLSDNADPARLALLPQEKAASLGHRYARAMDTLQAALARHSRWTDDDNLGAAAHVQLTLTIEPVAYSALEWAAQIADRTVEAFVVEESLFLAEMLIAAGADNVPLARKRRATGAPLLQAFARPPRMQRPGGQ